MKFVYKDEFSTALKRVIKMKKYKRIFAVFIMLTLIINIFSVSASAMSGTLKYSVDFKPEGVYYNDDRIPVTGWAFNYSGETVRCFYTVDSGARIYTDPVVRNDVAAAFASCTQRDCGFDQNINISSLSAGEHTFRFYAECAGETELICESEFDLRKIIVGRDAAPTGEYDADELSSINVVGWAFSSWGEETDCYYSVDDSNAIPLEKKKRTDVKTYYGDICTQEYCGYNFNIPISDFTLGEHTITFFAQCGEYKKTITTSDFKVISSSSDQQYSNDKYISGEYLIESTDSVRISGWAFDRNGNDVTCYYRIDDMPMIELVKVTRNDVKSVYPECQQTNCGYNEDISLSGLSKGAHEFRIYTLSGRALSVIKETDFIMVSSTGVIKIHSDFAPDKTYNLGENAYVNVQGWGYNTSGSAVKFYGSFDNGKQFYITPENRSDVFNSEDECYTLECGYKQRIFIGNLPAGNHKFTIKAVSGNQSKTAESTFSIVRPDYTVRFDLNGGAGGINSLSKTYGKNIVLPKTEPVRAYYRFKGWCASQDGKGEKYNPGEEFRQNANTVLYAVWERDTFLPKDNSGIAVDLKNGLIYGAENYNNDSSSFKDGFYNTNVQIQSDSIVTSTPVSLTDSGEVYLTAQAVILGDADCNGKADARDAVIAACISEGMLSTYSKAVFNAADCKRDGKIDDSDLSVMNNSGLLLVRPDSSGISSCGFYDTEFDVKENHDAPYGSLVIDGADSGSLPEKSGNKTTYYIDADVSDFNFFGLRYTTEAYYKGTLTYTVNGDNHSEEFFLEPSHGKNDFYSFIDGVFEGTRSSHPVSLSFEPLDNAEDGIEVYGLSLFNRAVPEKVVYLSTDKIKIGVNLDWGGSLSYYEDLDSSVQAVSDNGIIRIDSNAGERYSAEVLSESVNLVNCHDAGRLVQQSYYGTRNYDMGFFNGHYCAYNPVQGGNMYNDSSKIVDVRTVGDTLYIKCRPLDWAKAKEYITDSYMEAEYTISGDMLKTSCRFTDFSGYDPAYAGQELPAFYSAATLDRFVYYGGSDPWNDGELSEATGLDEYLYAHYPTFKSSENWGALTGEFDDSFSIGLYIPGVDTIAAGIYGSLTNQNENPGTSDSTSYLSGVRAFVFRSFEPIEYDFYVATGTVGHIRDTFRNIAE